MSLHDNANRYPPSPWKPMASSLVTLNIIQAIATIAAIAAAALDDTCY